MSIFDDPNFLRALSPVDAGPEGLPIQGGGPLSMGAPQPDIMGAQAPAMRQKRGIGNVLHDFFSGARIAQNMRDPGVAAWGDLLSNIARISRGEDPTHAQSDYAQQLLGYDQQQSDWQARNEELARAGQGRNAFADLLMNPENQQSEAALARADPGTLLDYRKVRTDEQQAQAQAEHTARIDAFNAGKPVPLGGNGGYMVFAPDDPEANANGWVIHEGAPPMQKFETGEGQAGLINPKTGTFVPIGGKKIPARKTSFVEVQGPDGVPIKQLVDAETGQPIRTIGASPVKGGAAASGGAGDVTSILRDNGVTLSGPDPIADLIKASPSGIVQNYAGKIPALFGDTTPGQKALGTLQTIDNSIVLALAGGKLGAQVSDADRKFFEKLGGQISDPNVTTGKRLAAWAQVRSRLKSIVDHEKSGGPKAAAPSGGNAAAIAEARRRGLIK
jgi:hypothetical protein